MTRLTAAELAALESAKGSGSDIDIEALLREARIMRAQVVSELFGKALRWLGTSLGLHQMGEQLARRRLYRRTLAALSRLDDRELADIGISPTELRSAARAAAGLDAATRPGLFARLRQAAAEARERRQAARDLALLDRHLLQDIGVEPDGIEAYVEEARRKVDQPASAVITTAPAVALNLLFPAEREHKAPTGWNKAPRPAANQVEERARAA